MTKRDPGQWATLILGSLCGVCALIATLQTLGVGSGYRLLADEPAALDEDLKQPLTQIEFKLPEFANYNEIAARTLFTSDRKPRPIDDKAGAIAAGAEPPPVPLNVTLLAVLIDPELEMAVLRDNASSAVLRVRRGMPLPGELAGWTLRELEPRKVVFDGGPQQGSAELKLDMSKTPTAAAPPPVPVPPPGAMPQPPGAPAATPTAASLPADEAARQAQVQQIIEQRRAQMRAEAEKMQQQQGKQ